MPRAGTTSQGAGLKQLFFLPQMWKFTQSRWVVRKEVATVTKVSEGLPDGWGWAWGRGAGLTPVARSSVRRT